MTSIWTFLLQTLTVSLAAALLLLLKYLLQAHLSPRWQYGVWGLLALRLLLPTATVGRYVLLPLPLWLETCKSLVESQLTTAFSAPFAPIRLHHVFPVLTGGTASITDWLFVLYTAGVLVTLCHYVLSYCRLRVLLRQGLPISDATQAQLDRVCAQYGLKDCPAVTIPGLPAAFICGIFRPILALPVETPVDDKVLLHELLHLRHHDAAQSVLWCLFRALHWCNPFLQYVFRRIGNDMESLCDQRVLERLVGEERRDYGGILLSMANEKYPRAPGTTSLGNGGANISRRIAAIAHFKRYPKGMALVSLCIAAILGPALLLGSQATDLSYQIGRYSEENPWPFHYAMALARTTRCTTVAGALDTYAKGLLKDNGVYLAIASPTSRHPALAAEMQRNSEQDDWRLDYVNGNLPGYIAESYQDIPYLVYNLAARADGSYDALLVFPRCAYRIETAPGEVLTYRSEYQEEETQQPNGVEVLPVHVYREDGWVVEPTEAQHTVLCDRYVSGIFLIDPMITQSLSQTQTFPGETGDFTLYTHAEYYVDNTQTQQTDDFMASFLGASNQFAPTPKPQAQFARGYQRVSIKYTCRDWDANHSPIQADLHLTSVPEQGDLSEAMLQNNTLGTSVAGSTSTEFGKRVSDIAYTSDVLDETGSITCEDKISIDTKHLPNSLRTHCAAQVWLNREPVETKFFDIPLTNETGGVS